MNSQNAPAKHSSIFALLVVLALCSVGVTLVHLSVALNNVVIFAIAFLMAGLVVLHYMGLRLEGPLVVWTFLISIILFAILVVTLMPDIAHTPVGFLKGR